MKNEPAFPLKKDGPGGYEEIWHGLTKREYFAAMAWMACPMEKSPEKLARWCIKYADALIKELEKEPKS